MRVQRIGPTPLQALNMVLGSIDAVRNARAVYLLVATLALSGLLLSQARRALGIDALPWAIAAAGAAFFVTFYGSNAVGLMLMDEACGRASRDARHALKNALQRGHRLLLVVLSVLLVVALLALAVGMLLRAATLPAVGPLLLSIVVPIAVPLLGFAALLLLTVVGPIAAPAVWAGLGVRAVLVLLAREARGRLPQVVLLSAAVSLLSAAVAGLVSFVVLAGGRMLLALTAFGSGIELDPQPFLAALFGLGIRTPARAPLSAEASAAITGAGVVFVLGLVLPGVVYLRGLCALFLTLHPPPEGPA